MATVLSNRYSIDIDGLQLAHFKEVSSISIEVPAVEQKVATGEGRVELLSYPGNVKYGDITLKAGKVADATEFYDWLQSVVDGHYQKALRNGTIVQLPSDKDSPSFTGDRWNFEGAWPSKWEISQSGAGTNELIVESLTIKISRIWRD
ncbi:MAG: phage tail protein [Actinobacteria bacterium]|nr:phage tail protein [Actinomycetota bacterium]